MPRRRRSDVEELSLLDARVTTAVCVPAIRKAVTAWRAERYKGASDTSRILLNYWFRTDHRLPNGARFQYHPAQREAMESLIYVYEVAAARRHRDLLSGLLQTFLAYTSSSTTCIRGTASRWRRVVARRKSSG